MKNLLSIILLLSLISAQTFAQEVSKSKQSVKFDLNSGYIMINDATLGIGISHTDKPFSKSFFGITTIHGYQVDKNFIVAGGTGVSFYNGGTMVPVFLDLRYNLFVNKYSPYIYGDGGILLNIDGGTMFFIHPGIGAAYTINRNLRANAGVGMFVQQKDHRDSFINIKLGLTFKPK